MTADYVLIEGDLDEILEYNIEQASRRDRDFHNDIASIKEDHQDRGCYLCEISVENTTSHFNMLKWDYIHIADHMNKPIEVDGKQI